MKRVIMAGAIIASAITLTFAATRNNTHKAANKGTNFYSCYVQDTVPKKKDTTRRPIPDSIELRSNAGK